LADSACFVWEEKNAKFLGCFVEFGFDWSSIHGTIFLLLDSSLTREASSKFLSHFKYNNFQMRERTFGEFSKASIGCFESFFSFVALKFECSIFFVFVLRIHFFDKIFFAIITSS